VIDVPVRYTVERGPVWAVEPGDFEVELATSSEDVKHTLRFAVVEA